MSMAPRAQVCTRHLTVVSNWNPHIISNLSVLSVEELQCLATWKEGSSRYLVGKVHHSHASSNEERYRCFVYEKASLGTEPEYLHGDDGVDFRVAQSGDATCNGLSSPLEGSRTMTLSKGTLRSHGSESGLGSGLARPVSVTASSQAKCRFPAWLTGSSQWHTLDYRRAYTFHHRNTTLRIANISASG